MELAQAPLARASFILAKEFGWTLKQFNEMTIGQVLLFLQMLKDQKRRKAGE